MTNIDNISNRLLRLRTDLNLTMKDVADKIGIPVSTYRDWEYGSSIKGEPYIQLSKIFKISLIYLLTGKESDQGEIMNHVKYIQSQIDDLYKSIGLAFGDS